MKTVCVVLWIFFLCLVAAGAGCETAPSTPKSLAGADNGFNTSIYTHYMPVKIDIMPLTEFVCDSEIEEKTKINVYVSLLDSFGCQGKAPGVFRFELYEKVKHSAEPKGKRVVIWPDIDLIERGENNEHWRDFLRTYEFNLDYPRLPDGQGQTSSDFEPSSNQSYILQVTFLCPNDKRLSDEFEVKYTE